MGFRACRGIGCLAFSFALTQLFLETPGFLLNSPNLALEVLLTNSLGLQCFFQVLFAFLFAQPFLLFSDGTLTLLR